MTGTLAVTAGRGEAGLGRAAPGPRRYAPEIAGAGPWPGWGGAGPGREGFIPARRASRYPGFLFRRIYPRKKYADRRYKRFPGYYGGYYDEDGTIRRYRDLESPAARHETRRIGNAADMAAAGSCDGRFGMITAMTMTRANRAAEAKAVAELAPFPKPDSGHIGTVSLTVRVRWASRNAMKPRIQCVLTPWNPGFTASGSGPVNIMKPH